MKKKTALQIIMAIAAILINLSCVTRIGPEYISVYTLDKAKAMKDVEYYYNHARYNKNQILTAAIMIKNSKYNIPTLVRSAELLSKFGYHTNVIMSITKIAANASDEHEELLEIVDLSVTVLSHSGDIIRAANQIVNADTYADYQKAIKGVERIKGTADYKSVEEALILHRFL